MQALDDLRDTFEVMSKEMDNIESEFNEKFSFAIKERKRQKIDSLPGTLKEAVDMFSKSLVANAALGQHIMGEFVTAKEKEWDSYRTAVTQWELNKYLARY